LKLLRATPIRMETWGLYRG